LLNIKKGGHNDVKCTKLVLEMLPNMHSILLNILLGYFGWMAENDRITKDQLRLIINQAFHDASDEVRVVMIV